jgi:DNA-binding FadR family transcriptional regulator
MRQAQKDLALIRGYVERADVAEHGRLPPERELAETLGITRNRLRGGLRKLVAEGLIWRHVGKGTFVGPRALPSTGKIQAASLAKLVSPPDVMEARLSIEPELARLAALRANGHDLAEIDRCIVKMSATKDWQDWAIWDQKFHRAVAQAARNTLMIAMFDMAQAHRSHEVYGKLNEAFATKARRKQATNEHVAIARAVRARDWQEAESLMRAHLQVVKRQIFGDA